MLEKIETTKQVCKGKTHSKKILGQMPTVKFMSGKERDENPPFLPTPRRAVLANARQKMQSLR